MKKEDLQQLDDAIARLLTQMENEDPLGDPYDQLVNQLERLEKMRQKRKPQKLSRDTLATVVGNLAGIGVIVAYERSHVMVSKAFQQFIRPKT